jgi:hypothetical protein
LDFIMDHGCLTPTGTEEDLIAAKWWTLAGIGFVFTEAGLGGETLKVFGLGAMDINLRPLTYEFTGWRLFASPRATMD